MVPVPRDAYRPQSHARASRTLTLIRSQSIASLEVGSTSARSARLAVNRACSASLSAGESRRADMGDEGKRERVEEQ
jgi:hypothetical protein